MKSIAVFEFQRRTPVRWPSWIALAVGVAVLLVAAESNRALVASVEETASHKCVLETVLRKDKAKAFAKGKKPDQTKPLMDTLAPLIYPWNHVLTELEAANGERVNVVKFEHSYRDNTVHLTIAAANYETIQALTERLQSASGPSATWHTQSISRNPGGLLAQIEGRYSE